MVDGYRIAILVQWTVLFASIAARLWFDSRHESTVARRRMQVLSLAAATMMAATLLSGVVARAADAGLHARHADDVPRVDVDVLPRAHAAALARRLVAPARDPPRSKTAMGDMFRTETQTEMAAVILAPSVRMVGARGGALVTHDGKLLAEYGATDTLENMQRRRAQHATSVAGCTVSR